jgi:NAD(P)-dependent dehydrogenase (short-subunit alcohol dehydrogenase family)
MKLENRRALVTGGSRGIGRAIVEAFLQEGAQVLTVARTEKDLEDVAELSDRVFAARCDVTSRADVDRLPGLVAQAFGGLDILVNNAGVWMERHFLEYTPAEWDRTLATNLTAVFDVTQALLPVLLESSSARIINIASIDGEVGFPKLVAQCASKAGVIGFTKALAKEFWDQPLTVNAIAPAAVDKTIPYATTPARVPAASFTLPWDVARAAVYLACDEGVRINGSCLDVHGVGFVAS